MAVQLDSSTNVLFRGMSFSLDKNSIDVKTFLDEAGKISQIPWVVTSLEQDTALMEEDLLLPGITYTAMPQNRNISTQEAWDLFYALLDLEGPSIAFDFIEPSFSPLMVDPNDPQLKSIFGYDRFNTSHTEGKFEWHLAEDQLNVRKAWSYSKKHGKASRGEGVKICHPDSGFIKHREFNPDGASENITKMQDYFGSDEDPQVYVRTSEDLFKDEKGGSHGLSTGSVIISRDDHHSGPHVTGVAPDATLFSYRVTAPGKVFPSPFLFDTQKAYLAQAIENGVEKGCRVISMSLGGFRERRLHNAIKKAVEKGTIVLAAAGNNVMSVVYPASDRNVIAVGGSNIHREPWELSSRGPLVDISAPAAAVYRATVEDEVDKVKRSSGTSYAVALTAGVAALWLAHHGHKHLVELYGAHNINEVFRFLLKKTVSQDEKSQKLRERKEFGAGIINALALLQEPLTSKAGLERLGIVLSKKDWDRKQQKITDSLDADPLAYSLGWETTTEDAANISQGLLKSLGVYLGFLGDDLQTFTKKYAKEILHKFRLDGYLPLSLSTTASTYASLNKLNDEQIRETLDQSPEVLQHLNFFKAYLLGCNLSDSLRTSIHGEVVVTV